MEICPTVRGHSDAVDAQRLAAELEPAHAAATEPMPIHPCLGIDPASARRDLPRGFCPCLFQQRKAPVFPVARLLRSRPSGVRGPVLLPP